MLTYILSGAGAPGIAAALTAAGETIATVCTALIIWMSARKRKTEGKRDFIMLHAAVYAWVAGIALLAAGIAVYAMAA